MYFIYILRTLDNSLYIGVTENVDERVAAYKSGNGAEWTPIPLRCSVSVLPASYYTQFCTKARTPAEEMVAS
jgi:predicted GIY-YIG superfamily endonuclease